MLFNFTLLTLQFLFGQCGYLLALIHKNNPTFTLWIVLYHLYIILRLPLRFFPVNRKFYKQPATDLLFSSFVNFRYSEKPVKTGNSVNKINI